MCGNPRQQDRSIGALRRLRFRYWRLGRNQPARQLHRLDRERQRRGPGDDRYSARPLQPDQHRDRGEFGARLQRSATGDRRTSERHDVPHWGLHQQFNGRLLGASMSDVRINRIGKACAVNRVSGGNRRIGLLYGLVAYYRFAGTVTDSSGNFQTLTEGGGSEPVTYGSGKIGQGLVDGGGIRTPLNGVSDHSPLSISCWMLCSAATIGGSPFISFADGFGDTGVTVCQFVGGLAGVTADTSFNLTGAIVDAAWNHVVVTFNGNSQWQLYINGSFVGQDTYSPISWATQTFSIQASGINDIIPVDEVAIYSRILVPGEVTRLYGGGSGFDPTA